LDRLAEDMADDTGCAWQAVGMGTTVTLTLNPTVDMSTATDYVVADRKLRCERRTFDPGGGGINVARVMHELGAPVRALWTRGGMTGQRLEQLLEATSIDQQPIPIEGDTRDHLMVVERSSGRQFRFNLPGPELSEAELAACLEAVERLDRETPYLVLSGSLPAGAPSDFYARLARAAPEGCKVVLDTSDQALARGVEAPLFLIKPNAGELARLAGTEIEGDDHIREVARAYIARGGVEVVVTSLGAAGAVATTADESWHVTAPTVNVRSAVGAGDSMVGGIVAGLAKGWSLRDAVRYGVAAGTATVKSEGTRLCRRDDVERLFAAI
jgi:6-phosphofructokinase 2